MIFCNMDIQLYACSYFHCVFPLFSHLINTHAQIYISHKVKKTNSDFIKDLQTKIQVEDKKRKYLVASLNTSVAQVAVKTDIEEMREMV